MKILLYSMKYYFCIQYDIINILIGFNGYYWIYETY